MSGKASNDNDSPPALDAPAPKKLKTNNNNNSKQSDLSSFFQPAQKKKKTPSTPTTTSSSSSSSSNNDNNVAVVDLMDEDKAASVSDNKNNPAASGHEENNEDRKPSASESATKDKPKSNKIPDPIVPTQVPTPRNVVWQSLHDNMVIVRKATNDTTPRTKVAAFDVDGTLVVWTCPSWPSRLTHYELWSSTVPAKLRALYDDGYKLVLVSNQGGIQKAHSGKKATLVKTVIDFLAAQIDRPVHAVLSTKSPKKEPQKSFHKPSPKMWRVAAQTVNQNQEFDVAQSLFVGDSADADDEQGGVDLKFAQAVSEQLSFSTPNDYFGPSDSERRQRKVRLGLQAVATPPPEALQARSALLGGYLSGPILLVLCGVQGSGKTYFCQQLLQNNSHWVHLSQDTINNGKPGKREKVESEAKAALDRGMSVVVDRMHLDKEQRKYFVEVAKAARVPAHVVLLNPPKDVISKRVRERTNHPAKVEGAQGAKMALGSLAKLVLPSYDEDDIIQLVNCVSTPEAVARLAAQYNRVGLQKEETVTGRDSTFDQVLLPNNVTMPTMALGTMNLGKKATKDAVLAATHAGFRAIDTAPTYKNEDRVGDALVEIKGKGGNVFVIAKIPKAAVDADQVRASFTATLEKLQRPNVDLLLLHWPCETVAEVWQPMEEFLKEGKCKALGVCNFNIDALVTLLANCTVPPCVNQVERHPLLGQWELVDFCARNNIFLQAHSPLGQGKDELLANPTVKAIAAKRSMSPAQVVLCWNLQQGVPVVPKCASKDHAQELAEARQQLLPKDMKELDGLDKGVRFVAPPFMYGNKPFCWGSRMPRK